MSIISSFTDLWRWLLRRNERHLPGIVQLRKMGTVVSIENDVFGVEHSDGRIIYALADPWIAEVGVGDRVEIGPRYPSTVTTRRGDKWSRDWILVRKLDP